MQARIDEVVAEARYAPALDPAIFAVVRHASDILILDIRSAWNAQLDSGTINRPLVEGLVWMNAAI